MEEIEVGKYRLVPKGTEFWSINNQSRLSNTDDQIVEIKHTTVMNKDYVYVKPMQLLFNLPGHIPTLIGQGQDEWGITFSKTLPYEIPSPDFLTFSYSSEKEEN
jgi:hypothetical protein